MSVYGGLERVAPGGLPDIRSGDVLARIDADVGSLDDFFVRGIVPAAAALLASVVACAVLGAIDGRLAVWLALVLVVGGVVVPLAARTASRGRGRAPGPGARSPAR